MIVHLDLKIASFAQNPFGRGERSRFRALSTRCGRFMHSEDTLTHEEEGALFNRAYARRSVPCGGAV